MGWEEAEDEGRGWREVVARFFVFDDGLLLLDGVSGEHGSVDERGGRDSGVRGNRPVVVVHGRR